MGNNNTSDIKEENNVREAEEKSHLDDLDEDSVKEENQTNSKAAETANTSDLENEISEEDTHQDGGKEENQNIPTSEAKVVLENAEKASDDTTIEHGKEVPPEDSQTDDLKGKTETVPTDEGKDVEEIAELLASNHIRSVSENDSFKEDTREGDANTENEMHPTAEDERNSFEGDTCNDDVNVDENPTAEDERNSFEGDTYNDDVNVDENPTAEGTDVQEIDAGLASDDKASDPKKDLTHEDNHADDKDESALILFGSGTDVPGKSIIIDSDDAIAGQEIAEVRQPEKSPNSDSVGDGDEKCEILSSSSLEGTEDFGKQTEPCLRKNLPITDHRQLADDEHTQEEEDTKVSTWDAVVGISDEAELQESLVADSNNKEQVKVIPESTLNESWPKGDFLDTNPLNPQDDDDDVIEGETQTQEKDISSDISSGIKSNGNLLTKVNYIIDDSLNSLSESVNEANPLMHDIEGKFKILGEEAKMNRSGSTTENSHDQNPGHCLQEPLNELKASNGERDEVERPETTENGHHFDPCDENTNMNSDDTNTVSKQKHLLVPEAEPVPLIATENGFEGREMLAEQCNSHLVTTDHVESFTMQSSDSFLNINSYQEESENQTKNHTATSMETSYWKKENDDEPIEKELKDSQESQHEEAASTSVFSEQCPNNLVSENGDYYETRESTTRLSTESSNPDNVTIFSQIQKSPSFNLNLQNGESSEESDQCPLLSQQKSLHIMDSWPQSENGHCSLEHEQMPVEEKIVVTMDRSYTEKSKAPLLCYSKEDDEGNNHAGTYKEMKSNSLNQKEKRKSTMSSFFINCMCCATVAN